MDYNNLIPAPIDGKNITTDWIEEIFDFQCATSNSKTYLGFVKDLPIRCDIIENALCWQFLVPTDWWHRDVVIPAMEELTKRLQVKDDADKGHRIHVRYRKSGNDTILWQELYWNNNDKPDTIMTLEQILQEYFGCKRPFDKDGRLTKHGDIAVQRLISLLHDLNAIGIINGSWNAQKRIDDIIDND